MFTLSLHCENRNRHSQVFTLRFMQLLLLCTLCEYQVGGLVAEGAESSAT